MRRYVSLDGGKPRAQYQERRYIALPEGLGNIYQSVFILKLRHYVGVPSWVASLDTHAIIYPPHLTQQSYPGCNMHLV